MLSHFSRVWLFATPWTIARQAPLSRGFSRQEYWSGLPFPLPGDLPDPGIEPESALPKTLQIWLKHQDYSIFPRFFVISNMLWLLGHPWCSDGNGGNAGGLVLSLGWEGPLEEEMATHSSIPAWSIPRTEPGGPRSVRHGWVSKRSVTSFQPEAARPSSCDCVFPLSSEPPDSGSADSLWCEGTFRSRAFLSRSTRLNSKRRNPGGNNLVQSLSLVHLFKTCISSSLLS